MFINLLPPKTRLKIQFRSMLRRFSRIWCLAGVGAMACAAVQIWECWHTGHRLAVLESRCLPLYAVQHEIQKDYKELQLLQSRCAMLDQLQPADHFIDLLGVLVQATRAELGKLHIQRLSLQSSQSAVSVASKSATRGAPAIPTLAATTSTLSLQGLADDDEALAQFVAALRQSGVFERVELKVSSQVSGGSRTARQYQLECRYEDLP